MKTQINNGGPAFPWEDFGKNPDQPTAHSGMYLRDWLAGQAMTAIIGSLYCTPETTFKEISGRAYAQADAMIKAREEMK
jgi:hypothetical protein